MKTWDLTHLIQEEMTVYPGTPPPLIRPACSVEEAGYKETLLTLFSHTGTHMDAPAHIFPRGVGLDQLPAEQFWGTAAVVDCRPLAPGGKIGLDCLKGGRVRYERAEFLLFLTGWDRYWGQDAYFHNYPVPDREMIRFILETGKKGVGMDTISIDSVEDKALTNHHHILGKNLIIVENLKGLENLPGAGEIHFFALPMKYIGADGAPVRALAIVR